MLRHQGPGLLVPSIGGKGGIKQEHKKLRKQRNRKLRKLQKHQKYKKQK